MLPSFTSGNWDGDVEQKGGMDRFTQKEVSWKFSFNGP